MPFRRKSLIPPKPEVHVIKRKEKLTVDETPYIVVFPKGYTNPKKHAVMNKYYRPVGGLPEQTNPE